MNRTDDHDGDADTPEASETPDTAGPAETDDTDDRGGAGEFAPRLAEIQANRATVDAAYRAYAIDQACERVREIEREIVTPAMKRIETEDPDRRLAGLENSLKGKDRLTEQVTRANARIPIPPGATEILDYP